MITQYTGSYGSISTDIRNIVASSVGIMDDYILMRTGDYEYSALVKSPWQDTAELIVITRTGNNSLYNVSRSSSDWDYRYSNEYYIYSNVGLGQKLDVPAYTHAASLAVCGIVVFLALKIMFKEVLFRTWLRSDRR